MVLCVVLSLQYMWYVFRQCLTSYFCGEFSFSMGMIWLPNSFDLMRVPGRWKGWFHRWEVSPSFHIWFVRMGQKCVPQIDFDLILSSGLLDYWISRMYRDFDLSDNPQGEWGSCILLTILDLWSCSTVPKWTVKDSITCAGRGLVGFGSRNVKDLNSDGVVALWKFD